MFRIIIATSLCLSFLVFFRAIGQPSRPASEAVAPSWNRIADSCFVTLYRDFYNPKGHYFNNTNQGDTTFHYWPQAHALDVLTDAYLRTHDQQYLNRMNNWMTGVRIRNGNTFLNEYYDDMLWNALAMFRVYEATNDKKWLDETLTLWDDIKTAWNDTLGGGMAWRKGQRYYKNTPVNGPAIILAARLYQRLKRPEDLAWATKVYAWQKKVLVDPVGGLVYDGINQNNDGQLNTDWKFTYCQGVWIGGTLELYHITHDPVYLADATKTASLTIRDPTLTTNGLMRDEGKGDGGLFKGVLVRYLTQLVLEKDLPRPLRTQYATLLKHNAETLWQQGTARPQFAFGTFWQHPPQAGQTGLSSQLSGTMLIEAMSLLTREGVYQR